MRKRLRRILGLGPSLARPLSEKEAREAVRVRVGTVGKGTPLVPPQSRGSEQGSVDARAR